MVIIAPMLLNWSLEYLPLVELVSFPSVLGFGPRDLWLLGKCCTPGPLTSISPNLWVLSRGSLFCLLKNVNPYITEIMWHFSMSACFTEHAVFRYQEFPPPPLLPPLLIFSLFPHHHLFVLLLFYFFFFLLLLFFPFRPITPFIVGCFAFYSFYNFFPFVVMIIFFIHLFIYFNIFISACRIVGFIMTF